MRLNRFLIALLLSMCSQYCLALDTTEACSELEEQRNALLSKLSTSIKEANMAGQCIGWRAIKNSKTIELNNPCNEFLEQKNNLLGNMSTSLIEANKAGICLGAIYAACGSTSYSVAAQRIADNSYREINKYDIRRITDCYGW